MGTRRELPAERSTERNKNNQIEKKNLGERLSKGVACCEHCFSSGKLNGGALLQLSRERLQQSIAPSLDNGPVAKKTALHELGPGDFAVAEVREALDDDDRGLLPESPGLRRNFFSIPGATIFLGAPDSHSVLEDEHVGARDLAGNFDGEAFVQIGVLADGVTEGKLELVTLCVPVNRAGDLIPVEGRLVTPFDCSVFFRGIAAIAYVIVGTRPAQRTDGLPRVEPVQLD